MRLHAFLAGRVILRASHSADLFLPFNPHPCGTGGAAGGLSGGAGAGGTGAGDGSGWAGKGLAGGCGETGSGISVGDSSGLTRVESSMTSGVKSLGNIDAFLGVFRKFAFVRRKPLLVKDSTLLNAKITQVI